MNPEDIKAAALAATIDRENRKVVVGGIAFNPTEARQLAEGLSALAAEAEAIPNHRPGDVFLGENEYLYISDGVTLLRLPEFQGTFAVAVPEKDIKWRQLTPVTLRTALGLGTPGMPVGEVVRAAVLAGAVSE